MEKLFTEFLSNYDGFSSSFRGRKTYKESWEKEKIAELKNGENYNNKTYWDPEKLTYGELTSKCAEDMISIIKRSVQS